MWIFVLSCGKANFRRLLLNSMTPYPRADLPDIQRCMTELHTKEFSVNYPENHACFASDDYEVLPEMVFNAARSFPFGSSGCPSVLRPAGILECLEYSVGLALAATLARFSAAILAGYLSIDPDEELECARLIALPKTSSSYRPSAVGETPLRLFWQDRLAWMQPGDNSSHTPSSSVVASVVVGADGRFLCALA